MPEIDNPNITPENNEVDMPETMDMNTFQLIAKLMEGSLNQSNNITNSLIQIYEKQSQERGEALEDLMNLFDELREEVPRSSRAGQLVNLAYRIASYGMYPSGRSDFKPKYYPPYMGE